MIHAPLLRFAAASWLACLYADPAHAQLATGTWVQHPTPGQPGLTMTIESCCHGGSHIVYRLTGHNEVLLTVDSPLDGTEVPVLKPDGKPSGETMAIKRVDARHTVTVLKVDGAQFGVSRAELSSDGKTLTIVNEITQAVSGRVPGTKTDIWTKQ